MDWESLESLLAEKSVGDHGAASGTGWQGEGIDKGRRLDRLTGKVFEVVGFKFGTGHRLTSFRPGFGDFKGRICHFHGDHVTLVVAEVVPDVGHDSSKVPSRESGSLGGHAGTVGLPAACRALQAVEDDHRQTLGFPQHPRGSHQRREVRAVALGVRAVAAVALGRVDFRSLRHVGGERLFGSRPGFRCSGGGATDIAFAKVGLITEQLAGTSEDAPGDEDRKTTGGKSPDGNRFDAVVDDPVLACTGRRFTHHSTMGLGHIDRVVKVWFLIGQRHDWK